MGYLVIMRRVGERLILTAKTDFKAGQEIEIMVSDASNGKADLAIKAPQEIGISRKGTHIQEGDVVNKHHARIGHTKAR